MTSARPSTAPVSTATTVENGALIVNEPCRVVAGVNVYQTVLPEELPNAQEGARSSGSTVAPLMSTLSPKNGRGVITVASAKLSFDAASSSAVTAMRGCNGSSRGQRSEERRGGEE